MAAETSENFAVTDISMEWKIPDFYPLRARRFQVVSPIITYIDAGWIMGLYREDEYYELFIQGHFDRPTRRTVNYTIGIKKADGSVYKSVVGRNDMIYSDEPHGTKRFIGRNILMRDKKDVAPDGTLVVFCNMSLNRNYFQNSSANTIIQTENAHINHKLKGDLESLLLSGTHFDTTVKVSDREFKVHRAILGVRSCVFEAMFSHDTTERNTGMVEIKDCDPEVFQYFLLFLYCGKVEELSAKNAAQVYELADKYCVDELKIAYVNIMERNFCVDGFCDVVGVALKYNEHELLKSAARFFSKNTKGVLMTDKWKCFQKEHPVEANELLVKAIEHRDNE